VREASPRGGPSRVARGRVWIYRTAQTSGMSTAARPATVRRTTRSTARALLVALAVAGPLAGLSACGSLDGSAHPTAPVPAAVTGPAAAGGPAVGAGPGVPVGTAPAADASGSGGSGSGGSGSGASNGSAGSGGAGRPGTGGSGTGGSGGGTTGHHGGGSSGTGGSADPGASVPAAKVTSLRVAVAPTCPVHGTPDAPFSSPGTDVTIAWTVTGAPGAALAVDQPGLYGAYGGDYPASGTLQLSFGCTPGATTSHTYTIWPKGVHGVSKTITVSARSDG
jgi:hypothetical protein